MRFLWTDTETTGLNPEDSGIFELGLILVDSTEHVKTTCERFFVLNPLSDKILYHEESGKIHGYTKEQIEDLPPESEQVIKIELFLREACSMWQPDDSKKSKLIMAGYNAKFDYDHLKALLERYGYKMEDYFESFIADVFLQVKKASMQKAIPYLENRKLGTLCKHFGIELENAHDAMADIRATRLLAVKLQSIGIPLL